MIHVYWNKYGLIQTDATNDIVVYSFLAWLITESISMHSVHLPFQCSKVYRLHDQTNQDNSFNFRSTIEKPTCKLGENSSFSLFFFFDKNRNTGFSSRHLLRLQKCCMNSRFRTGIFMDPMISFWFCLYISNIMY